MPRSAVTVPDRRQLIVDAALRRMTALGYEGTTVGDIAADLDISKAAVGYYFRRKEDFLVEFVTPVLDELDEAVDPHDDIETVLSKYLAVLIEHHERAKWIDTDPVIRSHDEFGPRLTEINSRLVRLVVGGSRKSADRIRGLAVLGGIWRPVRELPAEMLNAQREEIVRVAIAASES